MKTWCGKCKKECGLYVSVGPMQYSTDEFWGQVATVPIGREVLALSSCCMYVSYIDEDCWEQLDENYLEIDEDKFNYD